MWMTIAQGADRSGGSGWCGHRTHLKREWKTIAHWSQGTPRSFSNLQTHEVKTIFPQKKRSSPRVTKKDDRFFCCSVVHFPSSIIQYLSNSNVYTFENNASVNTLNDKKTIANGRESDRVKLRLVEFNTDDENHIYINKNTRTFVHYFH